MRQLAGAFVVAACCLLPTVAAGDLITNGSFEVVPSGATGQGLLPTGWFHVGGGADTFSNSGAYGLAPGAGGAFSGTIADDGANWVAGASAPSRGPTTTSIAGEAFGTTLNQILTPGGSYQVDASLYRNTTSWPDHPGGYQVFLSATTSGTGAVLLGALGTRGTNSWADYSLMFSAPTDAGARPYVLFVPYMVVNPYAGPYPNSYIGIDSVSLNAVPEPSSFLFAVLSLGPLGVLARRRRVRF